MTEFSIHDWLAWSPSLQTTEEWLEWSQSESLRTDHRPDGAEPDLEGVDSRQRRRLSRLTEMLLYVADGVCARAGITPSELPSVFASRHGEVETTVDLLEAIGRDGLISPMGFSNSVHNTASGYFGINADNHHGSHSVASGIDTFPQGLLDALALRRSAGTDSVLYVFGDILLPEPLDPWESDPPEEFAIGMVLGDASGENALAIDMDKSSTADNTARPGLSFMNQALKGNTSFTITTRRYDWQFEIDRFPGLTS